MGCMLKYLLVFLILSFTLVRLSSQGRAIPKLMVSSEKLEGEDKFVVMVRSLIGSSPPRCDKRYSWWSSSSSSSSCKAIQVPIDPTVIKHHHQQRSSITIIAYSRGDDYVSNYKPIYWKCKCGNLIFNP